MNIFIGILLFILGSLVGAGIFYCYTCYKINKQLEYLHNKWGI